MTSLEALPEWSWEPRKGRFEIGLAKLAQFSVREGHSRVPRTRVENGFKLGIWVGSRRSRRGSLNEEQVAALEAKPGWA